MLFKIAAHKFASMADLQGRQGDGGGCWEVHFRIFFQDWELETHFSEHISTVKVQEWKDSLVWKNDGRGKLSVKSYCKSLRAENSFLFLAKEIWGSQTPLRTRFIAQETVWGKILTVDMLMKRSGPWSIGATLVKTMKNRWTTF